MRIYQHDNSDAFRFHLIGPLNAHTAPELERCWFSASSVLGSRPLIVNLSEMSAIDEAGARLLARLRDSGARFTAGKKCEMRLARLLGPQLLIEAGPRQPQAWRSATLAMAGRARRLGRLATRFLSSCWRTTRCVS
ncbi:MAG: STAS domain-containing protein [Bryobacterales bacterium]|nr:STAS domain-containing protein [Bryobacterales bacterium]